VDFYRTGTRFLSAALFPVAATAAVFSHELLLIWTRNPELALSAAPIVSVFLIGTALNGAMHFPYALQLAFGATRLPLTINAVLLTIMLPLTVVLALEFGAVGGAMAWALLNFVYLLFGTWLTHRHLLRRLATTWLVFDVALPALLSTVTIWLLGGEIRRLGYSSATTFLLGCILCAVCSLSLLLLNRRTRLVMYSLYSTRN
jgi:O-antigen/teichoic acid export membrane protein